MSDTLSPVKRHALLKDLSRDHHHGLLLCWKIRKGQTLGIPAKRIRSYCTFFFKEHLVAHFREEEELVFPMLLAENELVKKAIQQHRRLERLFLKEEDDNKAVTLLEEELEQHIRFEERVLFNEIQDNASNEQWVKLAQEIGQNEGLKPNDIVWKDEFWVETHSARNAG